MIKSYFTFEIIVTAIISLAALGFLYYLSFTGFKLFLIFGLGVVAFFAINHFVRAIIETYQDNRYLDNSNNENNYRRQ